MKTRSKPKLPAARYVSIDLETTGLNPKTDQILEIGIIIDDLNKKLDTFKKITKKRFVLRHKHIQGNPYAINMNQKLIAEIFMGRSKALVCPNECATKITGFLRRHKISNPILVAGKNVAGFDIPFLLNLPEYDYGKHFYFRHRCLDPGSLYYRPKIDGSEPPNLQTCLDRAGILRNVNHTALDDAYDVVLVLRKYFTPSAL